ncbi:PAAR domain-containing protein, partial [Burkholderia pseudomallei]
MGFAFICEGDTTTHGGRVVGCNVANTVHGRAIALLGDMVTCPRCGGIYPIVSVKRELNMTFGDRPIATDG